MSITKLALIPPGGPSGPFWGVIGVPVGRIIALRMGSEEYAKFVVQAGNATLCDFDTIQEASTKLRGIIERDFPRGKYRPVDEGAEDYIIRSVMEAIFGTESIK